METLLTDSVEVAATFLEKGEVVAFPTETVFGLGAVVFNESAVRKVFEAKSRPADNPLIAHIASDEQIEKLAKTVTRDARLLIEHFFPGPLTIVLRKRDEVPLVATGGLETIGVRMPLNRTARSLIKLVGRPLVAPSANLSGRPSPTRWQDVYEDMCGRIACVLKGEAPEIGIESTVVDCSGDKVLLLRPGKVTLEDLQRVLPQVGNESSLAELKRSPGTRYRHYAPRGEVHLVGHPPADPVASSAYIGMDKPSTDLEFVVSRVCNSTEEYAASVFSFFRECDSLKVSVIYCQMVPKVGLGMALMDRLERAARG